ncbi:murein biosynthesis integral membrane protein MurJ [Deinococcus peraridilitoris]|uniref:Probable lipid II flippase MurJ n=1 Tax=Deinococcus peraridilitoris (strain DSM 19664 / LMG 22246 / CIP 109416 / KR-200) TaxID=937777 RepID=L0A5K6_DEIPD|nr:murein biosynthesis integral membrane protein MurJ [Deinococcus peraridilitoris]AFZ68719.1 integral membrane protein MviN [Deinococcus peraridilitoris DSM 19664]
MNAPTEKTAALSRSALRNTLIVMAGTLGSRLSGVVRQQIINLFDDRLVDAFSAASRVPNLFRELLAEGALVNSFIPVYKSLDAGERRQLARTFTGVLIAINLLVVALGIFAAPWIVQGVLLASNSNIDAELAIYITRLVMPFLLLISLSSIAMGLLNADEHFRESSFAPIAFNIASITMLLLLPKTATWLGIGWTVGGLAQFLVQLPALRRFGLLPTPRLRVNPALLRVLIQMAPFALTTSARQFLNVFVTRFLSNAALFPAGTAAGYMNAEAMFTMANGLFVVSPALALFPRFAQLRAEGDWDAFRRLTLSLLRTVTFLAAPIGALLVVLAPYALSVFNLRSGFSPTRFVAGSEILAGWGLALLPWAINTVLLRTFYARERTREAVTISAISFCLEVGLYSLLTPRLGLYGFGVSTTIMGVLTGAALITLYQRQLGFPLRELGRHLLRVIPLAAVAGLVAWAVTLMLPDPGRFVPGVLGFAVASACGLAAYLALAVLLRMNEVGALMRRLKR